MAKIQSRDVRDALLTQIPDAMERLFHHASGFDVNEDGSRGEYTGEIVPDILMQLINKAIPMMNIDDDQMADKEVKAAKARTIDELVQLKADGVISHRQLAQYTEILKTNYEITELNQLIEKLEELEQ